VVPSDAGQITPDLFVRMREELDQIVKQEVAFWTDQFHNTDALRGYVTLGEEITEQTNAADLKIDTFCEREYDREVRYYRSLGDR